MPSGSVDERPKAAVLVVLGAGEGEPCALHFARGAVARLIAGENPVETLVEVIEGARRWRWPMPSSTWSALLRSSVGHFGGIQSAPAWALSPALLRAVERHAFLGGPLPRWPAEPRARGELGSCDSAPDPGLQGTIGVLARTASGEFYGAMASLDPLADAGSVSVWAQYGVSLAIGRRGGVLLVGACAMPRPQAMAERVYASDNWALASAELGAPDDCRAGHALLSEGRAWVTEGPLAWAVAEAEPTAPSTATAPTAPHLPGDAGSDRLDAAVPQ